MSSSKPRLFNGVGLIFAGFLTLHLFGGVQTLKCDRSQPNSAATCKLTNSGIFGDRITTIDAGQLQGATIQRQKSNYRVVLLTEMGKLNFTHAHKFGKAEQQKKADRIENFIHDRDLLSLSIQQNNNRLAYPFALMFIVGGVWEIYASSRLGT